jgi:nicotinamide mononucleotide transporter
MPQDGADGLSLSTVRATGYRHAMDKWLEYAGVITGILTVWLSTRQKIAAWPVALVNAGLYFLIFQRDGFYANMGLQVIYFGLSCYGWYQWKFGGTDRTELPVTRTPGRLVPVLAVTGMAATVGLGLLLADPAKPVMTWVDAGTTSTSLVAQWMMTRKLLENWLVWVVVDVIYVGMFVAAGLWPTAGLYAVFLVLASMGYVQWKRTLRA